LLKPPTERGKYGLTLKEINKVDSIYDKIFGSSFKDYSLGVLAIAEREYLQEKTFTEVGLEIEIVNN
jgi:hypothetical protein